MDSFAKIFDKKQQRLAPQLVPVPLTTPPEDGIMRIGDVVLFQSLHNDGTLAASMGQKLSAGDDLDPDEMFATFACPGLGAVSRAQKPFGREILNRLACEWTLRTFPM